jgi:hypothetical protein
MIFQNATISTDRVGNAVLTNHRCQWETPSLHERMMAVGAIYDARIFDDVGYDWRQGDVVTLVSLDNTALPQVTKYRTDLILQEPGPLQVIEIQLVGLAE